MDVSCPQCQTLYEFDEAQLRSAGSVTLQCSQCDHLFRLELPEELRDESQRRWMVRQHASGDVLYFWGFDELHRWLMEGKIDRRDAISRTGRRWSELGEVGEFAPIFQAVASIADLNRSAGATSRETSAPTALHPSERARRATAPQHRARDTPAPRPRTTPEVSRPPRGVEPSPVATTHPTPQPGKSAKAPRANLDVSRFGGGDARSSGESRPTGEGFQAGHLGQAELREDDWSLGDLSVTQSDSQLVLQGRGKRRSRGRLGAMVLGLVLVGIGAAAWYGGWVDHLLEGRAEEEGAEVASEIPDDEKGAGGRSLVETRRRVGDAVARSRRQVFLPQWAEAVAEARQQVRGARERSERAVRRSGSQGVNEVLAGARRALRRGDAKLARARYHRAIELDEGNPEAITGLGWALLELGSPDSAAAQFRRALHRQASFGDAYIGLGRAERARGNVQGAIEAYETYLARLPGGPQASIARFQSEELRRSLGQ
ncbi:hypothetical protein DL240_01555 [Lujinxingia litoralis]|uniref:Zinc finger/thioredoxin putative domain-containing protein n=1 Tax=Lujinxingia litoralis TaxID=2211119 RepID=A0A328C9Y0_9DELT|nr:zinc-ribbon domain-containing protein [Lujinxingia litoralis]RAL24922.1 hypothetical protein DL240_01555 [Lujinxingia litoralis]